MMIPQPLKKGDTIAIVSTARKITETELQPAITLAQSWGLKVLLGRTIGAADHQFAGDDALRTADFQQALDNKNIKGIWCARGGYGTIRMVDALDFTTFLKHPKWIAGYSDITVLHNHINKMGVATIHGQMCLEIETKTQETRDTLKNAFFGNFNNGKDTLISTTEFPASKFQKEGKATGILFGGNLSVLYSLIDSPSEMDWEGKILFIEDLDEMLYHIDRMLQNLKRSGRLKQLAGIIVGGMSDMRDNTIPFGKSANQIIAETVQEYKYPVCYNFPAGHIADNRAMIFGAEVALNVSNNGVMMKYL